MSTEKLIFEMGAPGRRAALLPAMDVPTKPLDQLVPRDMLRAEPAPLPEVSEIEVVRTSPTFRSATLAWIPASIRWVHAR